MKLRKVCVNDAEAIAKIYRPYVTSTAITFEIEPPDEKEFFQRIEKSSQQFPWILAEVDDAVIGYAYASAHRTRAAYHWSVESSVYIDQAHHAKGIGKKLYTCLLDILKQQGVVNVFAGITLPNQKSEGFHRFFGFEEVGVYKKIGFKSGAWHDVLWMQLQLQTADEPKPLCLAKDLSYP